MSVVISTIVSRSASNCIAPQYYAPRCLLPYAPRLWVCIAILFIGYAQLIFFASNSNVSYIYPAFVLWAFDRLLRLLRLVYLSMAVGFKETDKAQIEVLSDNIIRVTAQRRLTWRAGQNMFMIMPRVSSWPFEAHPFTIATVPQELSPNKEQTDGPQKLMFVIKCRNGFTKKLKAAADKNGGSIQEKIFFDGPYGSPPLLRAFSTVVLIAGKLLSSSLASIRV